MTQIERREARIRRIRTRNLSEGKSSANLEEVAVNPEVHHSIGKTEASPEHIGLFVMNCNGDPSVKVEDLQPHNFLQVR
jgi:hypothetical protein